MEWTGAASNVSTLAGGLIQPVYLVLPSQARAYTDPTLVRTRGFFRASSTAAANSYGAIGVLAFTDPDDVLPTGGDIPAPYTRPDLDWIWHHFFHLVSTGFGTQGSDVYFAGDVFDSKAMRKLGADQGVMIVIQNASAASFLFGFGARCLIKE